MTDLFCKSCEVKLERGEAEWQEFRWWPDEHYKHLICPCCNFHVYEMYRPITWEELEKRALDEHGDRVTGKRGEKTASAIEGKPEIVSGLP